MNDALAAWIVGEGPEADRHAAAWKVFAPRVVAVRVAPTAVAPRLAAGEAPAAASVCLPGDDRTATTCALLDARAHVLLSPPTTPDAAAARALEASARTAGRLLVPAHPLLYAPGMLRLMAFVFARRLGAVQNVYAYRYGPAGVRLLHEPDDRDTEWELNALAAQVKTLCLLPEARFGGVRLSDGATGDFAISASMYYEDDILATVRVDPDATPPRRGLMVTLLGGVLQWEVDTARERLTLQRDQREKDLPAGAAPPYDVPHVAMISRFLKSVVAGEPPYEDAAAATRAAALVAAWRRA